MLRERFSFELFSLGRDYDVIKVVLDFIVQIPPQWDISHAYPSPTASTINQSTFYPHLSWKTNETTGLTKCRGEETP